MLGLARQHEYFIKNYVVSEINEVQIIIILIK